MSLQNVDRHISNFPGLLVIYTLIQFAASLSFVQRYKINLLSREILLCVCVCISEYICLLIFLLVIQLNGSDSRKMQSHTHTHKTICIYEYTLNMYSLQLYIIFLAIKKRAFLTVQCTYLYIIMINQINVGCYLMHFYLMVFLQHFSFLSC